MIRYSVANLLTTNLMPLPTRNQLETTAILASIYEQQLELSGIQRALTASRPDTNFRDILIKPHYFQMNTQ